MLLLQSNSTAYCSNNKDSEQETAAIKVIKFHSINSIYTLDDRLSKHLDKILALLVRIFRAKDFSLEF